MPGRTTKEYEEPVIAPKVAAALEDALRDEDEIQVDARLYSAGSLGVGLGIGIGLSASSGSLGAISPGSGTSAGGSTKKPKSG